MALKFLMLRQPVKIKLITIQIWLLCMAMLPVVVQAQFMFTTNDDNTITITGYTGSDGTAVIPDTTNSYPVTSIGNYAFFGHTSLTNIVIPDSVTSIGDDAFAICISLTSVTIPSGVTSIGFQTFVDCAGLTSVTIPNGVTNIGEQAFISCVGLTNIMIPSNCYTIGNQAFYACISLISATISSGVTNIGDQAFEGCSSLVNVIIPTNVISIGYWAFRDCTNLSSVAFSDGLTSIGDAAFWNCTRLTEVTIPSSITHMGDVAFEACSSLTNIVISGGVISIGSYAFFQCANLTSVTIPSSVVSIGALPFSECTNLVAILVDAANAAYCSVDGFLFNKDQTILIQYPAGKAGDYAIPDSITSISDWIFDESTYLTNVIIPSSVTGIGQAAFIDCINLRGIYFSGNASVSIDMFAFYNVTNATVYYLPDTTGWEATFAGFPTALWLPAMQSSDVSFGVRTNQFGFNINWASGQTVVVEASTNLVNWQPVQTNTLTTGSAYFSDSQWTNYPSRFYRLRSP
jgi:hypothetical protein